MVAGGLTVDDFISREALYEAMQTLRGVGRAYLWEPEKVLTTIEKAPPVDAVEVVHGRWVDNHCTVCGMTPIGEETWLKHGMEPPNFEFCMDYCPCCGAKMDGGNHNVG